MSESCACDRTETHVHNLTPRKLLLTVDTTDDNFMPKRVVVYGGEGDNLKKLSDVSIDE